MSSFSYNFSYLLLKPCPLKEKIILAGKASGCKRATEKLIKPIVCTPGLVEVDAGVVEQALQDRPLLRLVAVGVEVKVHHGAEVSPVAGECKWGPSSCPSPVHVNVWSVEKHFNYFIILFVYC